MARRPAVPLAPPAQMAEKIPPPDPSRKPVRRPRAGARGAGAFTEEEQAAMRERAAEVRAARRRGGAADEEAAVFAKLAAMPEPDRGLGERLHALIRETVPELTPRLWYGMPAYASEGKVVCFFQGARKFGARYATLGFSDRAALDEGEMWPTSYALAALGPAEEARVRALVARAVASRSR
jgi:hypothetical protein